MKWNHSEEDVIPLPEPSDESESDTSENEESDVSVSSSEKDLISDSDEEPECFSFSATQENTKKAQKLASQAIRLQKDELKRKRKEIVLQNIKQREQKRKKIDSKKLPDAVLKNLDEEFGVKTSEDKVEEPLEKAEEKEKDAEFENVTTSGNITFKCKVLSTEAQKTKYIPQKVAHFKEQMLYGSRIKREKSNRHAVLKREKQCVKR